MHRLSKLLIAAGAAAVVAALSPGLASASTIAPRAPVARGIAAPPVIAAGYFAVPKPGGAPAFTHIQDTFTVPQVACTGTQTAVAEQRAGIDGINDATIERVGISEGCLQGQIAYWAWYQMYPASAVVGFNMPHAGDTVDLSVTEDSGHYTLSVHDLSSGQSFTVVRTCSTCHHSSAQVTAGPPTGTPLADFGSVDFKGIVVTDSLGVSGGLANPAWDTGKLTDPGSPRAVAGPLHTLPGPPHSAFVDQWVP